ncbi:MAG: methionine biosynthesis protein MetW [Hyphomicrobiaceae bacterium]
MLETSAEGRANSRHRIDHLLIAEMVTRGARVLDVGCGDGELLELLAETKDVEGRGVEISREGVNRSVARGLSVIQGDADFDLVNYPDGAFDFAILSLTIQATERPRHVVEQLLRIGRRAIVSFPNFGHWRIRAQFALKGRMPVTGTLPLSWYDTPNIHLCTIRDFEDLCAKLGARIEEQVALDSEGRRFTMFQKVLPNLFGTQAVFLLSREGGGRAG